MANVNGHLSRQDQTGEVKSNTIDLNYKFDIKNFQGIQDSLVISEREKRVTSQSEADIKASPARKIEPFMAKQGEIFQLESCSSLSSSVLE